MEILLKREYKKKHHTIGFVSIDGKYFCDCLEDTDRNLTQNMTIAEINAIKEYGNTAIPTGRYKLMPYDSPKFGCVLPALIAVPGFSYILIHWGNTIAHTLGCLLFGKNKAVGKVLNSRKTVEELMEKYINPAWERGEEVWIEIK